MITVLILNMIGLNFGCEYYETDWWEDNEDDEIDL